MTGLPWVLLYITAISGSVCGAKNPNNISIRPSTPSAPPNQASATVPVITAAEDSTMPTWNAAEDSS